jgi:predicted nucleic acid-binding protein
MRFLDTNIIIRFLTGDDPAKASDCYALFQRLGSGAESVTTSEVIIAEVVYVLSSRAQYGLSHADIRGRLLPLLAARGLRLLQKRVCLRALDLYAAHPFLDYEDALSVAYMEHERIAELYSYDRGFDRVTGVQRVEPQP